MKLLRMNIVGYLILMWGVAAALGVSGCARPFDDLAGGRGWLTGDPDQWSMPESGTHHTPGSLQTEAASGEGKLQLQENTGVEAYVRLALLRNPSIRAASRRVERLSQRVAQVTSLDDPMYQLAPMGEMAETAAGQVDLMSRISQKFPFPGKLKTKGAIAIQDIAMARSDLKKVRLRVASDVRRAYWRYYLAQRALEVMTHNRKLMKQFFQIAKAKYKADTASQPDVLRASTELSNIDNELITWRQRRQSAAAMLNSLLDRSVTAPLPQTPAMPLDKLSLKLDRLLEKAALHNPQLKKIRQRIEKARKQRHLANLNRWPDLTVGVNYNAVGTNGLAPSSTGQDQWWFTFGVNLPIWQSRLNAAEREAVMGILQGAADLTAQRNRLAFLVEDAFLRVDTQQRQVILFRDVIVPQARQTVQASASVYRAGRISFLTLVDNWRKMLDFELMYHQNLSQLEQSFAQLQELVGEDLKRNPSSTRSTSLTSTSPVSLPSSGVSHHE